MVNPRPRFLVLRGGAIGDFVMTLPALQALRRQWPNAHVEIVGYPHIAALAVAGGLADRVISLDKAEIARLFAWRAELPPAQMEYIRSFDLIISYLYDLDGTVQKNLVAAGARQVIYGDPIVKRGHAVEHLLKPLESLAIYPNGGDRPELVLPEDAVARGRDRTRRFGSRPFAVHPGSGSERKNWPLDRFVDLAGRIRRRKLGDPYFILGEADHALREQLIADGVDVPVLTDCPLTGVAEALAVSAGFVGNDSGVTHLAAALGIPVVALFGPSDATLWGPRGPRVRVIQDGPTWAATSVEVVEAALPNAVSEPGAV